ncbi:MAG TPA: LysM peptidoglycan-binding domain-containing protein [Acidobacteriaceae bacterium]
MNSERLRRITIASVVVLAAVGVALSFGFQLIRPSAMGELPTKAAPAAQPSSASTAPAQAAPVVVALPTRPRDTASVPAFDIVRVEPDGDAVIAGRTAPGAPVELLRGNEVLGRVVADRNGEFVLVPPRLPSGSYQIALRAKRPDGSEATSERSAAVTVEPRSVGQLTNLPKPLDEAVTVPSKPVAPSSQAKSIVLETVAAGKDGKVTVRGHAGAGAAINLYLNDTFVTSATTGADKNFSVTINEGVRPGRYRVRLEEVDPSSAAIVAHAEQQFEVAEPEAIAAGPLQATVSDQNDKVEGGKPQMAMASSVVAARSPSDVIVPRITTATVTPGDSLWRISQQSYGAGDLYQLIVRANRGKIRNPDLIYPKQIFVLPPH